MPEEVKLAVLITNPLDLLATCEKNAPRYEENGIATDNEDVEDELNLFNQVIFS